MPRGGFSPEQKARTCRVALKHPEGVDGKIAHCLCVTNKHKRVFAFEINDVRVAAY